MKNLFLDGGILLTDNQIEKLTEFKNLLLYYNEKFNLTSIKEEKEVLVKHFYDSIYGEKYFLKNSKVIEIGSGGGFPSIPLMIYRNDLSFTLVESTGKKCEYLKEIIKKLNLKGEVINGRAEDLAKKINYREKFDLVTARAVAKMNTLSEYCIPFIKIGGKFIAYKGETDVELIESENAIKILGGKIENKEEYNLPLDMGKRNIFVIKKVINTPEKYPRGNGKERSKPL